MVVNTNSLGDELHNVQNDLSFQRIRDTQGGYIRSVDETYISSQASILAPYISSPEKVFLTGLLDREKCIISGRFYINPVPGCIYFSLNPILLISRNLHFIENNPFSHINLAHTIGMLSFGNDDFYDDLTKFYKNSKFQWSEEDNKFSNSTSQLMDYRYYLRLVRHDFVQPELHEASTSYMYSVNINADVHH